MNTYDNYRNTTPTGPMCEPPAANPSLFLGLDNSNSLASECYTAAGRILMALAGQEAPASSDPVDKTAMRQLEWLNAKLRDLREVLGAISEVLGV